MTNTKWLLITAGAIMLASCAEYNTALKYGDVEYKYEVAKTCYMQGHYTRSLELFNQLLTATKGTGYADECLYLTAMSAYRQGDMETAAATFRRYYQTYPRGIYAEVSRFNTGKALYKSTPDPRLDQTQTVQAINELQAFLEMYPGSQEREQASDMLDDLNDKLIEKEQRTAQLYYDLGAYMGNAISGGSNYEACIVTAENALREYPYARPARRETFLMLILRSRYHLARQSVEAKRVERFRQAIDDYYGFANEFPESALMREAQTYFNKSQRALQGLPVDED